MAKRTKRLLAAVARRSGRGRRRRGGREHAGRDHAAQGPIKIGISLSLSGDFSDPGKAVKRGYELWAAYVNAHGGILGRQVQLKIVNDASEPEPGRHELPEPDHARPRRPRLRAVLVAAHGPVGDGREPLPLRVPRAGRRRAEGLRAQAAQPVLRAAGAGRQVRRLVRRAT